MLIVMGVGVGEGEGADVSCDEVWWVTKGVDRPPPRIRYGTTLLWHLLISGH